MAAPTKLFAWGANNHGQLCMGHKEDVLVPTEVTAEFLGNVRVVDISQICGGGGHTVILLSNGNVYSCGQNSRGQLGLGNDVGEECLTLQLVHGIVGRAVKLACGWEHTLCLTDNGTVWGWGTNSYCQLGLPKTVPASWTPRKIKIHHSEKITDIAAGLRHNLAVTETGHVFVWGCGRHGKLVHEENEIVQEISTPRKANTKSKIVAVTCGSHHSLALSEDGVIYAWGCNRHGAMGADPTAVKQVNSPTAITFPTDERVKEVLSGWSHVVAIAESKKIFTWGRNDYGQLGRDGTPYQPSLLQRTDILQVSPGAEHNLAVRAGDRKILSWGWNEHGICGSGGQQNVLVPQMIKNLQQSSARIVGTGYGTSFAVVQ